MAQQPKGAQLSKDVQQSKSGVRIVSNPLAAFSIYIMISWSRTFAPGIMMYKMI